MAKRSYWSIEYFDSGAGAGLGGWARDTKIPRAGLEEFSRVRESTVEFLDLADGSEAKLSSESKAGWQELVLIFPRQVVNESVKDQLLSYINNERGIRVHIPILTGASNYTEKIIEGYPIRLEETWNLDSKSQQRFTIRLTVHEFDLD